MFTKKERSAIMSKIRSKDTKIEILFRKALWAEGVRYRKNCSKCFGKPDIVIGKYKTVIFIDSCFWHKCPIHGYVPKSNLEYWTNKFERNKKRDKEVNKNYKDKGWNVIRVWEHDIKKKEIDKLIAKTVKKIKGAWCPPTTFERGKN